MNVEMVANLVISIPAATHLIYISTDQVYPGQGGPHSESGTGPVNVYGQSKLDGEFAACLHENTACLRTNIFGPSRTPDRSSLSDFVTKMLRQENPVTLFEDILFSPLQMRTLSEYIRRIVLVRLNGVFNLGCRDGTSKADFGLSIAGHLRLPTHAATVGVSTTLANRAPRPSDMRMDVTRIEAALGTNMPTLKEEIAKL